MSVPPRVATPVLQDESEEEIDEAEAELFGCIDALKARVAELSEEITILTNCSASQ